MTKFAHTEGMVPFRTRLRMFCIRFAIIVCLAFVYAYVNSVGAATQLCARPSDFPQVPREDVCLAQNIYNEGRGESEEGRAAIAWVVIQRTHDPRFKTTDVCSVVFAPGQFSWTSKPCMYPDTRTQEWQDALELARSVLAQRNDPPFTATFFLNPEKASAQGAAWIRQNANFVASIGNHQFFYRPPDKKPPPLSLQQLRTLRLVLQQTERIATLLAKTMSDEVPLWKAGTQLASVP